jgi:integrase
MARKHKEYSLFLRPTKHGDAVYHAKLWDVKAGRYTVSRSTGETDYDAALLKVPAIQREIAAGSEKRDDPLLIDFLLDFWRLDSNYAQMKRLRGKALSVKYVKNTRYTVERFIVPWQGFKGIRLSGVTPRIVERWALDMSSAGVGPRFINIGLQAMKVPLRWAWRQGIVAAYRLETVSKLAESAREPGVLTPAEVRAIIELRDADERAHAVVLLAVLAGLRRGEARGIKIADVDFDSSVLHIRNNWQDGEGLKRPKWGSVRDVPLPDVLAGILLGLREENPYGGDAFVLYHVEADRPIAASTIARGFAQIMSAIGIDAAERQRRHLTYHGLRHTFISLARTVMPDFAAMMLAGHRSPEMLTRYSHAGVIDLAGARAQLAQAVSGKGNRKTRNGRSQSASRNHPVAR